MLKIIGWFWFVSGIFGMIFSFCYQAMICISKKYVDEYVDKLVESIIFFTLSFLIVLYCYKYITSSQNGKELKKIELKNTLLQKKDRIEKPHGT